MNYGNRALFLLFIVAWVGVAANAVWYCVTLKWAFEAPNDCFGRGLDARGKCLASPTIDKTPKAASKPGSKKAKLERLTPASRTDLVDRPGLDVASPDRLGSDTDKDLREKSSKDLEAREDHVDPLRDRDSLRPSSPDLGTRREERTLDVRGESVHKITDPVPKPVVKGDTPERVGRKGKGRKKAKTKIPKLNSKPDGLSEDWD